MLLSNRTVGGSHHRLRDAANILEEEEEEDIDLSLLHKNIWNMLQG